MDPRFESGGFGDCPNCATPLVRSGDDVAADRRAAKAKRELAELEGGAAV